MSAKLSLAVDARDHAQGAFDAPVTLVEYGDFECPYCGSAYPIVKSIVSQLGTDIRFVFRNFPLGDLHPHAELAAEAAEAAGAQGSFWDMHDLLFENQTDLSAPALVRYAKQAVLDPTRWALDVHRHAFANKVREDLTSGFASGVKGTPTFYINGWRYDFQYDEASLLSALEAALQGEGSAVAARSHVSSQSRRSPKNWM